MELTNFQNRLECSFSQQKKMPTLVSAYGLHKCSCHLTAQTLRSLNQAEAWLWGVCSFSPVSCVPFPPTGELECEWVLQSPWPHLHLALKFYLCPGKLSRSGKTHLVSAHGIHRNREAICSGSALWSASANVWDKIHPRVQNAAPPSRPSSAQSI